jgi:negative regulator of flagellin synthesis FlgM
MKEIFMEITPTGFDPKLPLIDRKIDRTDKGIDRSSEDVARNQAGKVAMTSNPLGGGISPKEKVDLSEKTDAIKKSKDLAQNAPDIRDDKVDKIKAAIKDGTYSVEPESLVDKILDEEEELFF